MYTRKWKWNSDQFLNFMHLPYSVRKNGIIELGDDGSSNYFIAVEDGDNHKSMYSISINTVQKIIENLTEV